MCNLLILLLARETDPVSGHHLFKKYKPLSILVPALMSVMVAVRHHYDGVAREVAVEGPMRMENLAEPLIIIPVDRWSRISEKALRFAMKLSDQVQAVHVDAEECYEEVSRNWQQNVGGPFAQAGRAVPELVFLESPYRFVLTPLLDYIGKVERECPDRQIAVLVPELVVKQWWQPNGGGPVARAGRAVPELVFLESPYRFVLTPLLDYIGKVERECPDRQIAVLVPELVVK